MSNLVASISGLVAFIGAAALAHPIGFGLRNAARWTRALAGSVFLVVATSLLVAASLTGTTLLWGVGIGVGLGGMSGLRWSQSDLLTSLGHGRRGGANGADRA